MIGGSYDGTTATMVAARGEDVPGLVAIVPIGGSAAGTATPTATACATPSTPSARPTRGSTRRWRSTSASLARRPPTRATRSSATSSTSRANPCESVAAHDPGLRPHARLRLLLARARLPQGRREHPRRRPRGPRLAGLQREAGEGVDLYRALNRTPLQAPLHVAGRPLDAGRAELAAAARPLLRPHAARRGQRRRLRAPGDHRGRARRRAGAPASAPRPRGRRPARGRRR